MKENKVNTKSEKVCDLLSDHEIEKQLEFAKRFSSDDWAACCQHEDFCRAVGACEMEVAEVIAHRILCP